VLSQEKNRQIPESGFTLFWTMRPFLIGIGNWQYYLSITTTNRTPRSTHGAVPVTNNPEKSIQTPSFFPSPLLPFELNLRDPKLGVAQIQN
jgi:hypothetical protein